MKVSIVVHIIVNVSIVLLLFLSVNLGLFYMESFPLAVYPNDVFEKLVPASNASSNRFTIVSYNIYNMPYEMFRKGCTDEYPFEKLMAYHGWRYRTKVLALPSPGSIFYSGGVQIYSKWPILEIKESVFPRHWHFLLDAEFYANKGVLYVKIDKGGVPIHVFGTHAHSGDGEQDHQARMTEMNAIAKLKDGLNIPEDELVVFAGDFNGYKVQRPNQYNELMKTLNASDCTMQGATLFTYDRSRNPFVKQDQESSLLDFILYSKEHKQPKSCVFWAEQLTDKKAFQYCTSVLYRLTKYVNPESIFCLQSQQTTHLSDHFPVTASFEL
ncbi:hypothetical protein Ciccas_003805 [Cichlidogyrus casuarinus]|uniref:sphingomyelin phosphodiesterase n=1 Tax=Cichlidogyrus casuarinus TaxID=1844966 RepID=A0ABD2QDB3_9PLAT